MPQFEFVVEPDEPVESAPAPPPLPIELAPLPVAIGFKNPLAVRIGLVMSIATFLVALIVGPFIILWMLVAGALGAWFYGKRTGEQLTPLGGARLGWITGVFTILLVLMSIAAAALAVTDPAFVETFTAQMRQRGAGDAAQQFVKALQNPGQLAQVVLQVSLLCGLLPVLGGMLGAKLLGRPRTL